MKKHYYIKGIKLLNRYGSLIFCENCKRILGSINRLGYRYINLSLTCKCDVFCNVEIAKTVNTSDPFERVERMPMSKNGINICKKCGTPLFGIIDDRVKNYSFYVECSCGEKYDLMPSFPSRLGKTLEEIKNKKISERSKE